MKIESEYQTLSSQLDQFTDLDGVISVLDTYLKLHEGKV